MCKFSIKSYKALRKFWDQVTQICQNFEKNISRVYPLTFSWRSSITDFWQCPEHASDSCIVLQKFSYWVSPPVIDNYCLLDLIDLHCVKCVRIRSYSGPYFPAFGLNTERYGVSLRIQFEWGKIRTRITPNTETFHTALAIHIKLHQANL